MLHLLWKTQGRLNHTSELEVKIAAAGVQGRGPKKKNPEMIQSTVGRTIQMVTPKSDEKKQKPTTLQRKRK